MAFHVPSLFLFSIKICQQSIAQHEKYFCQNHSHFCFTPFYGFVKEKNKIVGIAYEFMSNGSLDGYILNNKERIDDFFKMTVLNRIVQGIDYLHSNSLVHRDLKPSNILIDHDFNIFIHDFETIREIDEDSTFTYDFGSDQYGSPELYKGLDISFSTDIFSLGQIIYFIFEKKNRFGHDNNEQIFERLLNNDVPEIEKGPKEIRRISQQCVKLKASERPTIKHIKEIVIQLNSFDFLEENIINKKSMNFDQNEMIQYFTSSIFLCSEKVEQFNKYMNYVSLFIQLMLHNDFPNVICWLGVAYNKGDYVSYDYSKSLKYLELAKDLDNSDALYYLGNIYINGEGVEKDESKGLDLLELAARKRNPKALFFIGGLYYFGEFYPQNDEIAKKFFELTAEQNSPDAYLALSSMYKYGQGVQPDVSKAKHYYELAFQSNKIEIKQDDSRESQDLFYLGVSYDKGFGFNVDHKKALEYYYASSKLNNSNSDFEIGLHYLKGIGIAKDITKAIEFFEKSAAANNPRAQYALGLFYSDGQYTEIDYSKTKYFFELAAEQNYPDAINDLGMLYYYGNGVNQDYLKAKEYLEKAAKLKNSNALFNLGFLYFKGFGVEIDYPKATQYFEQSAKLHNGNAFLQLGILYYEGKGVSQNYSKAIKYLETAAKLNVSDAFIQLGIIYYKGGRMKRDLKKAKLNFEKAIEMSNIDGYYYLGIVYYDEKEYVKAKECYEKASNQNSNALTTLGQLYLYGKGVEKDYSKARECYEKAAKLDNQSALLNLAYLYYYGLWVAIDYLRAKYYNEQCAKHDNSFAFFNLGVVYLCGNGVQQDMKKSLYYFELSAKQNNPSANNILGVLYLEGEGVEKDYSKAKHYFELASYQNYSYSLYYLGLLNYRQKNYRKAREYFEMSRQKNNPNALFYLGYIYENAKGVDRDIDKSIQYYKESCLKKDFVDQNFAFEYNNETTSYFEMNEYNFNYYRSNNDLGLIYLFENDHQKKDNELAEKFLKEYPFGQNNYGLFCEFYLNKKENAIYMYNRSSKHQFSLAEFNLARICDEERKTEESMEHYKLVSEYENVITMFRNQPITDDERLNISKIFLTCFANLKLAQYYLNEESEINIETAKHYLMKSMFQPLFRLLFLSTCNSYSFSLKYIYQKGKIKISNLIDFYLNFPLFKPNNSNCNSSSEWRISDTQTKEKKSTISIQNKEHEDFDYSNFINANEDKNNKEKYKEKAYNKKYFEEYKNMHFKNPDFNFYPNSGEINNQNTEFQGYIENILQNMKDLDEEQDTKFDRKANMNIFSLISKNDEIKRMLKCTNSLYENLFGNIEEYKYDIENIIQNMKSIIYTPPYCILFGRIPINPEIDKVNDVNKSFYEGLYDNSCSIF